jgi:biotin carboxyl carrier protein
LRKLTIACITLLLITILTGCGGADKKPELKPETIVVPEVSSIPFDMIALEDAPAVVRKVAKAMEDEEYYNWITDRGTGYILIAPELDIERIEQRVPSENYAWLNVKLIEIEEEKTKEKEDDNKPTIVKFDLKTTPNAVGFQVADDETSATQPQPAPAKKPEPKAVEQTQANNQQNQPKDEEKGEETDIKGPAIRITNPMPGDAVSNPVAVSGQAGIANGSVRVRVINASGNVIAEKPVEVNGGKFETSLSFPPPANQEQGTVEAFIMNPRDNSEAGRISIYVTLLPSQ